VKSDPEAPTRLMHRVEAAARILDLSRSRVFELVATGELPSVKIGGSRRITQTALEDFVARLTTADDTP